MLIPRNGELLTVNMWPISLFTVNLKEIVTSYTPDVALNLAQGLSSESMIVLALSPVTFASKLLNALSSICVFSKYRV